MDGQNCCYAAKYETATTSTCTYIKNVESACTHLLRPQCIPYGHDDGCACCILVYITGIIVGKTVRRAAPRARLADCS